MRDGSGQNIVLIEENAVARWMRAQNIHQLAADPASDIRDFARADLQLEKVVPTASSLSIVMARARA